METVAAHARIPVKSSTAHRKRRQVAGSATTARTAVTIAMAGAVSATGLTESGQAAARPTPEQVRSQVDALFQRAEAATQKYDGAKATATRMGQQLDVLQDQLARRAQQTNTARDQLGWLAAERYRTGGEDPTLRLILTSTPGQFLERAVMQERADATEAAALRKLTGQESAERGAADRARGQLDAIEATERRLGTERQTIDGELTRAKQLLSQVDARQRAAIEQSDPGSAHAAAPTANPAAVLPASAAPSARAAAAVAFAYAQLGKPYLWGATGPSAYDCSGLTRAAWAAAGVSLPRTTYSQINAGARVPESRLQPGDLVFYYAGVSHVGIYVGHGRIIHAPHPGADIRLAPVDEMPFAGAVRPA